jgi:hypothetical protein
MVVMRGGKSVDRIVGALPKPQLSARIAPHLASGPTSGGATSHKMM